MNFLDISADDYSTIRNRVRSRFPRPLRERDRVRGDCKPRTLTPALPSREREPKDHLHKNQMQRLMNAVFKRTALVTLIMLCNVAAAQNYPVKPIRLLVGFSAGGSADGSARSIATRMGAA